MARDETQDWLIPSTAVPTVVELEGRIDEALAVARAAEEAVRAVGASAVDAASQARRAAELAERASVAAARAQPPEAVAADPTMTRFCERADRVMTRLRALERGPHRSRAAISAAADRRAGG